jgi:hypothetical protein
MTGLADTAAARQSRHPRPSTSARQNSPICTRQPSVDRGLRSRRSAVRVHFQIAVSNRRGHRLRLLGSKTGQLRPAAGRRRAELITGADYLAAPAIYAATIYVACRSRLPRARSYRIVVLGSACDAASWTSRSGTPASKLVGSGLPAMPNGSAWRPPGRGIFPRRCAFSFPCTSDCGSWGAARAGSGRWRSGGPAGPGRSWILERARCRPAVPSTTAVTGRAGPGSGRRGEREVSRPGPATARKRREAAPGPGMLAGRQRGRARSAYHSADVPVPPPASVHGCPARVRAGSVLRAACPRACCAATGARPPPGSSSPGRAAGR